ncbi:MAG: hypothetical protein HC884_08745 [Chloroflexaceae bacterium]|nr:hypothetical protein [Chloroflexaceae bacterium]
MSVRSVLIRMARSAVESALSQLMQQLNVVEEQALAPMRTMVQSVVGGIWIGEGANAFVEEVSSLVIPGVGEVGENITTMHTNVSSARDIIDRADEEVSRLVQSRLFDAFDFY